MTHTIQFDYAEGYGSFEHTLKTKTSDGVQIQIAFHGMDADHFTMNDIEYDVASDAYKGLYVGYGSALEQIILPVSEVIRQANASIEEIVSQVEAERHNDDLHRASFSSPC